MIAVSLKPIFYRYQECMGVYYNNDSLVNGLVRKLNGIKWSQTNKCWYLPLSVDSYQHVYKVLRGKAALDVTGLKDYLDRKSQGSFASPLSVVKKPFIPASSVIKLSTENHLGLEKFIEQLKLKSYSPSTITTYKNEFVQLLRLLKEKPVNELTTDGLRRYFVYCYEKLQLTENTLHSRINAIKFYYEQVLGREKFFWEIPRPKKPLLLPKILNETELGRIFKVIQNLKHKAIVFMAYSAGLRVSETVNLRIKDIDSNRMTIFIARSKGKKDRIVNLSPLLLDILRSYLRKEKTKPVRFLFEGARRGEPYSVRSAQQIFIDARIKAGISKKVSFHSLRHSFATHLLEKGVDIKYIKEILGHFDIRTTEIYLHVSKKDLVNVGSPLDDLREKGIL